MVCADFTLRKASSEDARAIAVIQVQASRAAYEAVAPPGYFYGFTAPRRVAAWRTVLARRRDTEQIIVAEESGQIRGYAHFGPSRDPSAPPSTAELYSLYVAPSHWRRGFGRRLLAESLRELARMTFDDVTLWVLATNRPARAFYERFGWTADGSEKAGHPAMTEVRYRTASGQWADADIDAQADRLIR
jgi:ribosomal protein S18 acetylase RimI-like enzyme